MAALAGIGGRLLERFNQVLTGRGMAPPAPERVAFAVEFVHLLVQATLEDDEEPDARREVIRLVTEQRTGLDEDAAALLTRLAEAPEFRGRVDLREQEAFVARFGAAAGKMLEAEEQEGPTLASFVAQHGVSAAIDLFDGMLAVWAAAGELVPADMRRAEHAARELGIDPVGYALLLRRHDARDLAGYTISLPHSRLSIGRSVGADLVLPDPRVALLHTELVRGASGWRVVDGDSGRPTVLNGRPVQGAPFGPGDELRIGPYAIRLTPDGQGVSVTSDRSTAALSAHGLTRSIQGVSLLDDVGFTVFAGEVVALIGPSGAGKTTLLNAIAGVAPADSGEVIFDGVPFHELLEGDRSRVGIVPQDDIVLPELTVEESLRFSGRLRLGGGASSADVGREVDRVIEELGIGHIRKNRIGDATRRGISGGQRKRVNLGQELLTRSTRVLFLDEPTSGLDPRASQDIVRLVRQLADRGRIVFIVTHDLTPQVMAQVDHLCVLAPGGRLAWFGPPADACRYFNVPTPDAIFGRFADRTPQEWATAWKQSPDCRRNVLAREELLRRSPPQATRPTKVRRPLLGQFVTLVRRYAKVKGRDYGGLLVLGIQAPILAAVMRIVFQLPTKEMLFMMSLSCLWFGMSASVRELLSDRVVWLRERRIGVGTLPYVGSKLTVLGMLVGVQCAFFALLNLVLFPEFPEYGFSALWVVLVSIVTGLVGMTLGLTVSAWNNSSEGAVGSLPLLLIPQIAFSGILLNLRRMPELALRLTDLDPARYAYDLLLKAAQDPDTGTFGGGKLASPPIRGNGDWNVLGVRGDLYNLGFKGDDPEDYGLGVDTLLLRLGIFAGVFVGLALVRVWRRRASG